MEIKLANAVDEWKVVLEKLQMPVLTTWKTIDMFAETQRSMKRTLVNSVRKSLWILMRMSFAE